MGKDKNYSEFKDVLVLRSYLTYGKWENKTLDGQYLLKNRDEIIEYVEDYVGEGEGYCQSDLDNILSGKSNTLYINMEGGDWDDPTGMILNLCTGETLLEEKNKEIEEIVKFLEREIR